MTNRIELNWDVDGVLDEQRYYCSETPIDLENLPTPKIVLDGDVRSYIDDAQLVLGKKYYVRISAVKNGLEKISSELEVIGGDEYFINVATLLHFESALTDTTGKRTWVVKGGATVSTVESKFGGSSLYIPNNASDISTSVSPLARYDLFTMEAWVYKQTGVNDPNGLNFIFSQTAGGASMQQGVSINTAGNLRFQRQSNVGSVVLLQDTGIVPLDVWNHVALTFDGTILRLFLNGKLVASVANADGWYPSGTFTIGSYRNPSYTTYGFYGYIDEVRITKGVCRYTSDFTPTNMPFPDL